MDKFRCNSDAKLFNKGFNQALSSNVHSEPTWIVYTNDNPKSYRDNICNRYNKYFQSIKWLLAVLINANVLFPTAVRATDVGGVSATANPVANSSGSVTNQAIQVLQGPYITNTYGDGISCQGPTLNITPFLTDSHSFQTPRQYYYNDPVYDVSDADNDGVPDNPGSILYHVPTRTGQKDQFNFNYGISATVSIPLDGSLQSRCKRAVDSRINYTNQLVANKRLDFEIARLKNCGELMKAGIVFHPKSKYAIICSDVLLVNPPGVVQNHSHSINPISSSSSSDQSGSSSSALETLSVGEPISEK